jgi:mannitol-1-phosphate/altronate dehydrogenase
VSGPRLRRASLCRLPAGVERPPYRASQVTAGVVHLGLGGFHRAHMARYTHDLMALDPAAQAWGIVGAGLLPADGPRLAALTEQDNLYTLTERDAAGETCTVIGALAGVIDAAASSAPLLAAIDDPAIRIVSLTITEAGYGLEPATKTLDPDHPAISADLAQPATPKSPVGVLVEAYRRRRAAGAPAFTALSCDNIQGNGKVLAAAVDAFARRVDPRLADWITANAAFPSTMVDRITPALSAAEIEALAAAHDVRDRTPVVCETFRQWVIEDRFAQGRPDWDRVGAQFVGDVTPYEAMKLRLLNASHLAIAALGQLAGHAFVDETVGETDFARYMRRLMDAETGPTVPPVPGVDLTAYKATLVARFANPRIRDTLQRINDDAPLNYLLDPLRERLAAGQESPLLTLALAAWMRRLAGHNDAGRPIAVRHPLAPELRGRAREGRGDPRGLLAVTSLFGDLGKRPAFVDALQASLEALWQNGTSTTLQRTIDKEPA